MELKLTKESKEIKKIREHSISIKNMDNGGLNSDFLFRSVEDEGEIVELLFPFGKNKWSKKPNKKMLENLCISEKVFFTILTEFINLDSRENEIIVSLVLDDFRYVDGDFPEDPDSIFNPDD